jgi:hypothetical protein
MKMIVALVAALNAATGAPVDVKSMPDRPPIMVPTLAPLPTLNPSAASPIEGAVGTTAISGIITNIQDGYVFVDGIPVQIGPDTQVKGQLRAGLDVHVQAKRRADGILEADEFDSSGKLEARPATAQPTEQTRNASADEPLATPTLLQEAKPSSIESRPTEDNHLKAAENPEVKPTAQSAALPAENAKVEPTAQPAAQTTGKVQVEPTEKPEVQPTARPSNDGGKTPQVTTPGQTGGKDSGSHQDSGPSKDGSDDHSGGN